MDGVHFHVPAPLDSLVDEDRRAFCSIHGDGALAPLPKILYLISMRNIKPANDGIFEGTNRHNMFASWAPGARTPPPGTFGASSTTSCSSSVVSDRYSGSYVPENDVNDRLVTTGVWISGNLNRRRPETSDGAQLMWNGVRRVRAVNQ